MANPEGDEGLAEGETLDGTTDATVAVCADATPATHRGLADGDSAHGIASCAGPLCWRDVSPTPCSLSC